MKARLHIIPIIPHFLAQEHHLISYIINSATFFTHGQTSLQNAFLNAFLSVP